jgi:hypothetical protein
VPAGSGRAVIPVPRAGVVVVVVTVAGARVVVVVAVAIPRAGVVLVIAVAIPRAGVVVVVIGLV